MIAVRRRELVLGAAALAAGCGGGSGSGAVSDEDMVLGAADAPATLIEYASTTCPHCAAFHHEVWPLLKEQYIDTNKLRFVFREYPTAPEQVALAQFQVARCGGADANQYMERIAAMFDQQQAIFSSGSTAGVRDKLIEIGATAGLSSEQVLECIADESGAERLRKTVEAAQREYDITGTPTLILNGRKLDQSSDPTVVTFEGLSRYIDEAIASG